MQIDFSTLEVFSLNLGTLCFSFYRIRKIVVLFLQGRPNSKITLIKTKGCYKTIVIYLLVIIIVVTMVIVAKS